MKSKVYAGVKKFLTLFGIRLLRINPSKDRIISDSCNLDLLFDVGANSGQYVELIRSQGYFKQIVSFEPLKKEHDQLYSISSKDKNWQIFERCAIGNATGSTIINVSQNSFSSSLLPILDAHLAAAPESKYIDSESVPIYRLTDIWREKFASFNRVGIKIDVQGFEMEVLKGVQEMFDSVYFIQIEMSLIPVYENQELYFQIDEFLRKAGFRLWKVVPGFTHPEDGQQLQFDGIYVK